MQQNQAGPRCSGRRIRQRRWQKLLACEEQVHNKQQFYNLFICWVANRLSLVRVAMHRNSGHKTSTVNETPCIVWWGEVVVYRCISVTSTW